MLCRWLPGMFWPFFFFSLLFTYYKLSTQHSTHRILSLTNGTEIWWLLHHLFKLPIFIPSPKQLPSCTLVEMWSHFRPQSPWAEYARAQCWDSSVGRASLGAVQSAEFLYRSTLYCCPHCKQLGSAGPASSLSLLTDKKGNSLWSRSWIVQGLHNIRSAAKSKEEIFLPALCVVFKLCHVCAFT